MPQTPAKARIAAVYARVSTDDQADTGTSLESQVVAAVALTEREGYAVPSEFVLRETGSGAGMDRPLLSKLRMLARDRAVAAVAYYSPDRLSRGAVDLLAG